MTFLDYGVLVIIGFSVILSVIRGLVREVLALAAWALAFLAAWLFGGQVAVLMPAEISVTEFRELSGFAATFLAVLLAMSLISMAISQVIKSSGLSAEDRMLGAVFGLLRGYAIVMVLVLLAGTTALPEQPFWRSAVLRPLLERTAYVVKSWMPVEISRHIKYR